MKNVYYDPISLVSQCQRFLPDEGHGKWRPGKKVELLLGQSREIERVAGLSTHL